MESGLKPIEEIRAGDSVWGFNLATAQWQLQLVLETYQFDDFQEMLSIRLAEETIESTAGHPFWVIEGEELNSRPWPEHILGASKPDSIVPGRWVDSHDLRPGDVLLLKGSKPTRVLEVMCRPWTGRVYNFAVDDLACYAVGASCVLVHNSCGDIAAPITDALSRAAKDELRNAARDIWQQRTGRRAIWDDMDVHHRIPLEWSHQFPNADPNRIANLVGVSPENHTQITNAWNAWRQGLNGQVPTSAQVMQQALRIDEQFGHLMTFLP